MPFVIMICVIDVRDVSMKKGSNLITKINNMKKDGKEYKLPALQSFIFIVRN